MVWRDIYRYAWFGEIYIDTDGLARYNIYYNININNKRSIVFVPVVVLLGLGTSCGFADDDLVDSEDGDGCIGGEFDGPLFGFEMIEDVERQTILDSAVDYVDAVEGLPAETPHLGQGVFDFHAVVFGEYPGNLLEGLTVADVAVLLEAFELVALLLQLLGDVDLGGAGSGQELVVLDEVAEGGDAVVEGSLDVVHVAVGGASQDDGGQFAILAVPPEDGDLVTAYFLDEHFVGLSDLLHRGRAQAGQLHGPHALGQSPELEFG